MDIENRENEYFPFNLQSNFLKCYGILCRTTRNNTEIIKPKCFTTRHSSVLKDSYSGRSSIQTSHSSHAHLFPTFKTWHKLSSQSQNHLSLLFCQVISLLSSCYHVSLSKKFIQGYSFLGWMSFLYCLQCSKSDKTTYSSMVTTPWGLGVNSPIFRVWPRRALCGLVITDVSLRCLISQQDVTRWTSWWRNQRECKYKGRKTQEMTGKWKLVRWAWCDGN